MLTSRQKTADVREEPQKGEGEEDETHMELTTRRRSERKKLFWVEGTNEWLTDASEVGRLIFCLCGKKKKTNLRTGEKPSKRCILIKLKKKEVVAKCLFVVNQSLSLRHHGPVGGK